MVINQNIFREFRPELFPLFADINNFNIVYPNKN